MSQIRKVGTTLSLKSDLRSIEKSKKNFTLKPRRSRPSETALRLRSFPRGGPPLGENFFSKKIKINDPNKYIIPQSGTPKVGPHVSQTETPFGVLASRVRPLWYTVVQGTGRITVQNTVSRSTHGFWLVLFAFPCALLAHGFSVTRSKKPCTNQKIAFLLAAILFFKLKKLTDSLAFFSVWALWVGRLACVFA